MRLFQNNGLSRGFRQHNAAALRADSFTNALGAFLDTRFSASHILAPVLNEAREAFYTNGDDAHLQFLWARENGLRSNNIEQILLAQIEHHKTEVFYNLDPIRYDSAFVRRLPGCVKKSVCWRAAPSGNADLSAYDLVVCNFPSIIADWRRKGCNADYLAPAHDPVMDAYATAGVRRTDIVFVGGFSRHHLQRIAALEAAATVPGINARFHLEDSRLTRLANALPPLPGLMHYRHPRTIRKVRAGPLYGRALYTALAETKIVLNGAIDMAGKDRGNMRCFEATGLGAVLLTDVGNYPEGFRDGETMVTYRSADEIGGLVQRLLAEPQWAKAVANAGCAMVRDRYSKDRQWLRFQELV
jgi:hypothetical protein